MAVVALPPRQRLIGLRIRFGTDIEQRQYRRHRAALKGKSQAARASGRSWASLFLGWGDGFGFFLAGEDSGRRRIGPDPDAAAVEHRAAPSRHDEANYFSFFTELLMPAVKLLCRSQCINGVETFPLRPDWHGSCDLPSTGARPA